MPKSSPDPSEYKSKRKKSKTKRKRQREEEIEENVAMRDDEKITAEKAVNGSAITMTNTQSPEQGSDRPRKKYKKTKVEDILNDPDLPEQMYPRKKDKYKKRKGKKHDKEANRKDRDATGKKSQTKLSDTEETKSRTKSLVDESPNKKNKSKKKKDKRRKRSLEEVNDEGHEKLSKQSRIQMTMEMETGTASNGDNLQDKKRSHRDPLIVESSALDFTDRPFLKNGVTLMLFYQYVEPIWSLEVYQQVLKDVEKLGKSLNITGRMRVAREGLNCTLTSSRDSIVKFCQTLRRKPEFKTTEFKLTNDLPEQQRFPHLKVIEVIELVHYGLEGEKAPPIQEYKGCHLEPKEYHKKIAEKDTVMIDVRNHYEALIGHFQPPGKDQWLDPMMRKSTEFPVWLDKPETKEKLKGKQVLMYCTGGIRCERATALLKYKMENDPEIKNLGIKEVYQLQGGIDKYFKEFPDGGFWKGKNYVFDKRYAHAPPQLEGQELNGEIKSEPMGKCEACQKPWDRFRGKRRCPTCGVPSLICKECFLEDQKTKKKKLRDVRCDLCVAENVTSKHQLREKENLDIEIYERKLAEKGLIPQPEVQGERLKVTPSGSVATEMAKAKFKTIPSAKTKDKNFTGNAKVHVKPRDVPQQISNPRNVTRLFLKNMCRETMREETLMEFLPGITHIVWKSDGKTGKFLGQGWVEMATPEDAAKAVAKNGQRVLNRPLYINFQPADLKDVWPPPRSSVEYLLAANGTGRS